jgi:hypothetical protein
MNKIRLSRASPRWAGYFWRAPSPQSPARAMSVFSQSAKPPQVGLGTAGNYAFLTGSAVINNGPSVISGNLGVSPGTAVTGFGRGSSEPRMRAASGFVRDHRVGGRHNHEE